MVTDRTGIPLGVATDAASVPETVLAGVALADIPAAAGVPLDVPVVADRGYDSDPLRQELAARGYVLVAPHRRGRKRKPTGGGSGDIVGGTSWSGRSRGCTATGGW